MKIHPRDRLVSKARTDLQKRILEWFKEYELTDMEIIDIFSGVIMGNIHGFTKMLIKEERKDGDI